MQTLSCILHVSLEDHDGGMKNRKYPRCDVVWRGGCDSFFDAETLAAHHQSDEMVGFDIVQRERGCGRVSRLEW